MFRTAIIAAALLVCGQTLAQTQSEGNRVEVNGMQMYYEVSGAGDPLIVLHGAYMNITSMGEIIPRLAETHLVYALEFQRHGRTNDIDRPITYQNLADDIAAFMDAVSIEKADIVGYSMGATAGLQLAIRHPSRVLSQTFDFLSAHDPQRSNRGQRRNRIPDLRGACCIILSADQAMPTLGKVCDGTLTDACLAVAG